ncbi:UNVERIFIED_CONTAM: Callose synthase 12 [Sesamum calycinum]|uniref:Callose synthase 12 n=1 Tax=Sesamum calycinum TaxID=2727403 RepID=A0AAW2IZ97_9LAMI
MTFVTNLLKKRVEVRAAAAALRAVGDLRRPPFSTWKPHYDLLDWLALFFGFQESNVRNQREHLVLHLANAQMRLSPPPDNIDTLDPLPSCAASAAIS